MRGQVHSRDGPEPAVQGAECQHGCGVCGGGGCLSADDATRVNEPAIVAQPIPIKESKPQDRLLRPLAAGAAVAASVAALAVFTLPRLTGESPAADPVQIVSKAPVPVSYANQSGTRWKNLAEPALESKLNRYLENHSEYASSGGMGVVPYSSFVSYDTTHSRP